MFQEDENSFPISEEEDVNNFSQEDLNEKEDTNCSICFKKFEDKAIIDSCFHEFCHFCLVEWSKIKPECPLCRHAFVRIFHNVKSIEVYDELFIDNSPIISGPILSAEFYPPNNRRSIYYDNLWARPQENSSLYRVSNVGFYRKNPACTHRFIPWLKRELTSLFPRKMALNNEITEVIMNLVLNYNINSPQFISHLDSRLYPFTSHFVYEFYQFAKSPHEMKTYDIVTVYAPKKSIENDKNFISMNDEQNNLDGEVITIDDQDSDSDCIILGVTKREQAPEVITISSSSSDIDEVIVSNPRTKDRKIELSNKYAENRLEREFHHVDSNSDSEHSNARMEQRSYHKRKLRIKPVEKRRRLENGFHPIFNNSDSDSDISKSSREMKRVHKKKSYEKKRPFERDSHNNNSDSNSDYSKASWELKSLPKSRSQSKSLEKKSSRSNSSEKRRSKSKSSEKRKQFERALRHNYNNSYSDHPKTSRKMETFSNSRSRSKSSDRKNQYERDSYHKYNNSYHDLPMTSKEMKGFRKRRSRSKSLEKRRQYERDSRHKYNEFYSDLPSTSRDMNSFPKRRSRSKSSEKRKQFEWSFLHTCNTSDFDSLEQRHEKNDYHIFSNAAPRKLKSVIKRKSRSRSVENIFESDDSDSDHPNTSKKLMSVIKRRSKSKSVEKRFDRDGPSGFKLQKASSDQKSAIKHSSKVKEFKSKHKHGKHHKPTKHHKSSKYEKKKYYSSDEEN